jgi:hypothetical protein
LHVTCETAGVCFAYIRFCRGDILHNACQSA